MAKKEYSEEERIEFLELAKEVGIARAIRQLGYPTFPTAKDWSKKYGVDINLNELSQFANSMKNFYSYEEKLFATQLLMDRIVEKMQNAEDLDADELKKLGESLKRCIETTNLIEGKATAITQNNNDPFESDIAALIEEQERIRKAKEV